MTFQPSAKQKVFFDWIQTGVGHAVLKARAGSGKTTTLVEGMRLMTGTVLFSAFNKTIANELIQRVPDNGMISVKTINAIGFGVVIKNSMHKVTLDADKKKNIVKEMLPNFIERREFGGVIQRILALLRANLEEITEKSVMDTADEHGLLLKYERLAWITAKVRLLADRSDTLFEEDGIVDFDDQIYLAVKGIRDDGWTTPKYDWVLVDEGQDMSAGNRILIQALAKLTTGRIVVVADPAQSIYGWRGAAYDSVPKLIEELKATELPLNICYRCPTKVVQFARQFVPDLESPPGMLEGEISTSNYESIPDIARPKDLILSRINAPNIQLYFRLIAQGVRAVIRGRDFGKSIVALIDRMIERERAPKHDLNAFLLVLKGWEQKEVARLIERDKESAADTLIDKVRCIEVVAEHCQTVEEITTKLDNLFRDEENHGRVILSSIHRAKGLEADRVIIVNHDQLPMKPRRPNAAIAQQERNCYYVAITRAKKELILA